MSMVTVSGFGDGPFFGTPLKEIVTFDAVTVHFK
jgi:hypothetical protein